MYHLRKQPALLTFMIVFCSASLPSFAQYTVTPTQAPQLALTRSTNGYDYVPTIMYDGNRYRMWWCGSRPNYPGDHIFYAEAPGINGPWKAPGNATPNSFSVVLAPSRIPGRFDADHVCDPSVFRLGGTYYMYYGGTYAGAPAMASTNLGVATSPDGVNWTRLNNGAPILSSHPTRYSLGANRPYGTGQPSAVGMGSGWIYMVHTDHLGLASNPGNGAGQFVLRSQDPLFHRGTQALTNAGWVALPDRAPGTAESASRYQLRTSYSLVEAFSVDWTYSDMFQGFVVARHNEGGVTDFDVFNNFDSAPRRLSYTRLTLAGGWNDGPGLVRRPDGHAMPSTTCGEVPIELMRADGPGIFSAQLKSARGRLTSAAPYCNDAVWGGVFNSWKIATPGLPLAVVVEGKRLQVALQAPADLLSKNTIGISSDLYHRIAYGGSLFSGNTTWTTPGQPAAFLLDDARLWPISCGALVTANRSQIRTVPAPIYGATPKGPALYCVQ